MAKQSQKLHEPVLAVITRSTVAVVVIVLGLGIATALYETRPTAKPVDEQQTPPEASVFEARLVDVRRQWRGFGVADAMDTADVPARVGAVVVELPNDVKPGSFVEAGQLLVRLDPTDFENAASRAEQALAELQAELKRLDIEEGRLRERLTLNEEDVRLAKADYERVAAMQQGGASAMQDVDARRRQMIAAEQSLSLTQDTLDQIAPRRLRSEAAMASQQTVLRQAKLDVQRASIASPIAGVIEHVDIEVGENVAIGQRVARVVSLGMIEVPLRLPATARHDLAIGDDVEVHSTNDTDLNCLATLSRMSPADDSNTRTATVYVEINQRDAARMFGQRQDAPLITPGMFLEGVVASGSVEPRWIAPRRSVLRGTVVVVKDGRLVRKPVKISYVIEAKLGAFGLPDDQWAVLDASTPLEEGELVMVNGSTSMLEGQAVRGVVVGRPSVDDGQAVEAAAGVDDRIARQGATNLAAPVGTEPTALEPEASP